MVVGEVPKYKELKSKWSTNEYPPHVNDLWKHVQQGVASTAASWKGKNALGTGLETCFFSW